MMLGTQPLEFLWDTITKFLGVVGRQVRERAIFRPAPDTFIGVQFRSTT